MTQIITPGLSSSLWLPGVGLVPVHVRQAMQAVEEYDADLMLAQDQADGSWVVLLKAGPEGRPFPVFNLGRELPAPERVKQMLYRADVRRRGHEIVASVERVNEARRKELADAHHDAAGEVAESIEWAMRKMGQTRHTKVYMPGDKN